MRISLPKGEQNKFINEILQKISVAAAAKLCNLSERTIRDWRREKFLMSKEAMNILSHQTKLPLPVDFEEKSDYWYVNPYPGYAAAIKSGKFGGSSEYRKKKQHEWWEMKGKLLNNPIFKRKPIRKPKKSKELAEFIGIMLGDGGITSYANQICITLNNRDDKEYIGFVSALIEKLFSRKPTVIDHKTAHAARILVSSMSLVEYLISLGLKTGNKTTLQVDIPDWIKNNKAYSLACVRGLVDTDGCIFKHTYKVNGNFYLYKKLAFTSLSEPIRESVFAILRSIGIKPRLSGHRDVRIDSQEDMEIYFKKVGSSNQKHLNKYYN